MAASWLLRGKILPPKQLAAIQARTPLVDAMMAGCARRLTVLEAPAGFGKTTLLALWRARLIAQDVRVGWLTLDRDDVGDALNTYLAFALSEAGIDMTSAGLPSDGPVPGKTDAIQLAAVLNAVAMHGAPACLILDDAEKVSEAEALWQIERILRYAPGNLHIAIAFRANPGLALADVALKGLVHRVDDTRLRFTAAEMADYLNGILPPHQIKAAMERAEGWPVALQMLRALAQREPGEGMRGAEPPAGLTATYITEQLFRTLTQQQQAFLLDVGLLDEASIPLVNHVRDSTDTVHILEEIEHLSALIAPLEGADDLFRIHPLLREYLCAVAERNPARAALIHRRAAGWLAAHGRLPAALHHAMAAGDRELAASLIERDGAVSIWIRSGMAEVAAANRIVDDAMIERHPRLGLMRCIVLIKQAKIREARACYEHVAAITDAFTRDHPDGDATALLRDSLFVRSMLALYGCQPLADDHLSVLERDMHDPSTDHIVMAHHKTVLCVSMLQSGRFDAAWRQGREAAEHCLAFDSIYGATFIDLHMGSIAMAQGEVQESLHRYRKARRAIRRHFPHDSGMKLIGDVLCAELELECNDISGARHSLARIVERVHATEAWYDIYAAAYGAAVDLYFSERGPGEALALLDDADRHVEHQGLGKLHTILDALRVSVLTWSGDTERALRVSERSQTTFGEVGLGNSQMPSWREVEALGTAWVSLMTRLGRHDEAELAAGKVLAYARENGIARAALRVGVLRACNAESAGDTKAAETFARDALRIVGRSGYFRPVLRDGAAFLPILARMNFDSEAEQLLAREIERRVKGAAAANHVPVFSPREMDVLHQLNRGLQDKIIARRLGVTEHTVRFHLKNIYAKTRAQGRLDAVTKARALGVLG